MSNSSELSFNSDMDVEEGTVVASVQVSVQESSAKAFESEVASESYVENSVHSIKRSEVSSSSQVLDQSSDHSAPEPRESLPDHTNSEKTEVDNEIQEENLDYEYELKDQSPPYTFQAPSDCVQTEGNQSQEMSNILIAENPTIFQRPTRKHKKRSSLYKRMNTYLEHSKEKIMKAAKDLFTDEMKKCTFTPTVNHSHKSKRSFQEFLNFQQQHLDNKDNKIRILKKKQSEINESFQPALCVNSFKILKEKKLSEPKVKVSKSPDTPFSFKPQTNSRERLQKRTKSIYEHLYESPKGQNPFGLSPSIQSNDTSRIAQSSYASPTNKSSEKAVIKKFEEEFSRVYEDLASTQGLSYSMYIKLLECMNMLGNEKDLALESWKQLSKGSECISKQPLLSFLLSVMNYKKAPKTHLKYLSFYQNRSKRPSTISSPSYSFKPNLSKKTRKLATSPKNRLEFLVNERQGHLEKWKRQQMERDKTELNKLKFSPKTNSNVLHKKNVHKKGSIAHIWEGLRSQDKCSTHRAISLYSLSVAMLAHNKEKAEDAKNDEFHDSMKACTFSPVIRKHLNFGKKPIGLPKGFVDAVSRVRISRSQRELDISRRKKPFKFTIERNSKHTDIFRSASLSTPLIRESSKSNSASRNAFYMLKHPFRIPGGNSASPILSETESDDNPVEISVKLPSGNVEKLMIYSEAEKMDAVDAFIRQHGLTGEICQHLREGVMAT